MENNAVEAVPIGQENLYIVTVVYNSQDCLSSFTDCLAAQSFAGWRLFAVDNASADASAQILSANPDDRISLLRNGTNLGFAKAANQGIRAALAKGADFIILINADTQLPPDFLAQFIASRNELQADVIVPRIMRLDRPDEAWYAGGHFDDEWAFKNVHEPFDPFDTRRSRIVDFASGCCLGLTRNVLSSVGLLDESFFVYWEDADYCLRLRKAGIPIYYVNDVVMMHEGGHASGGENNAKFNRLFWCSYVQILRKHFGIAVTARTIIRISLKELGRSNNKGWALAAMLMAMFRGLTAPLVPQVRI